MENESTTVKCRLPARSAVLVAIADSPQADHQNEAQIVESVKPTDCW
jgi:hypothetical protein